ncbi:allatostatin-A receptor-like [Schistocerca serialis cubense]|uniref:allatostatin-A receptor-like n=1 Tax=Schistocerca serialis cubense TaxID=2023355 RepID=UPI00214F4F70|nr:allatostatin-A receptor-like [Schistocerca serialis cubense]
MRAVGAGGRSLAQWQRTEAAAAAAVAQPPLPPSATHSPPVPAPLNSPVSYLHTSACAQFLATRISFFLTSYVLPLLLIVSLYLRMLMRLWRAGAPGGHLSAESRRGKKRVTRMVVVVVAIFAVCWCPIQVILVLKTVGMYDITTAKVMLQIVSHVLAYMNSCVNPILYAFLSDNFRKAFRKVIYCGPAGGGGGAQRGRSVGQRQRADGAAAGAGANGGDAQLRPLHAHTANGTKTTRADASTDDLL